MSSADSEMSLEPSPVPAKEEESSPKPEAKTGKFYVHTVCRIRRRSCPKYKKGAVMFKSMNNVRLFFSFLCHSRLMKMFSLTFFTLGNVVCFLSSVIFLIFLSLSK